MATATALKVTTPSDTEIQLTREFDAPRDLLFRVFTDPKHIPQYWGRHKDTTTVDVMDVRPGGRWRFLTTAPDGDHAFRGEFREIVPPEKIVWTFEWEGAPGHISTETWILEDLGNGRTRMVATSRFDSKEDRDGMLQSGMESGARELYERLDQLLSALQKKSVR